MIRVLVAEDSPVAQQFLVHILNSDTEVQPPIEIITEEQLLPLEPNSSDVPDAPPEEVPPTPEATKKEDVVNKEAEIKRAWGKTDISNTNDIKTEDVIKK